MTIECHHQNLIQMSRADEREDIERKKEDIESTERIGKVKDVRKRNGRPKVFTPSFFHSGGTCTVQHSTYTTYV